MPLRVYIGGLAPSVGVSDVQRRFGRMGSSKVKNVDLMPCKHWEGHRGFGYLDLVSNNEDQEVQDFEQYKRMYHGTKWKGHRIRIEKAKPAFDHRLESGKAPVVEPVKPACRELRTKYCGKKRKFTEDDALDAKRDSDIVACIPRRDLDDDVVLHTESNPHDEENDVERGLSVLSEIFGDPVKAAKPVNQDKPATNQVQSTPAVFFKTDSSLNAMFSRVRKNSEDGVEGEAALDGYGKVEKSSFSLASMFTSTETEDDPESANCSIAADNSDDVDSVQTLVCMGSAFHRQDSLDQVEEQWRAAKDKTSANVKKQHKEKRRQVNK